MKSSAHIGSAGLNPFGGGWLFARDPLFYVAVLAGLVAWLLPKQHQGMAWTVVLGKAVLEECGFRYGVQGWLGDFAWGQRMVVPGISTANILTSLVFTGAHFIYHPPLWAAAVFVPSLIFGWAWERYCNILAPVLLHFLYNWLLFNRFLG